MGDEKQAFGILPGFGLNELVSCSIYTAAYEPQMAQITGVDISSKKSLESITEKDAERNNAVVPGFKKEYGWKEEIRKINSLYPHINGPCSMIVRDYEELERHMLNIFRATYSHYVLGKKNNLKGIFPDYCCGISARNMLCSFLLLGYPNAAYVLDEPDDHCYVIHPFVMKGSKEKGVIISDPTSDQLWKKQGSPRNLTWIVAGDKWEYCTEWRSGSNLFPNLIAHIGTLKKNKDEILADTSTAEFFNAAFSNPVEITRQDSKRYMKDRKVLWPF